MDSHNTLHNQEFHLFINIDYNHELRDMLQDVERSSERKPPI